jgi:hypothetical protein
MKSNKSAKCIFLIYLLPCGSCKLSIQDSALEDKKSENHSFIQYSDWATGCMTHTLSEASRQDVGPQNYPAYILMGLFPPELLQG